STWVLASRQGTSLPSYQITPSRSAIDISHPATRKWLDCTKAGPLTICGCRFSHQEVVLSNRLKSYWPPARYRAHFMLGLRDAVPALIATGTWGMVTGIAIVKSGLSEALATFMTLAVYAGSAQLTALPLMREGVPLWLIFTAGFIVNIRFLIFGAALQPFFRHLSWVKRLGVGFFSTDI